MWADQQRFMLLC